MCHPRYVKRSDPWDLQSRQGDSAPSPNKIRVKINHDTFRQANPRGMRRPCCAGCRPPSIPTTQFPDCCRCSLSGDHYPRAAIQAFLWRSAETQRGGIVTSVGSFYSPHLAQTGTQRQPSEAKSMPIDQEGAGNKNRRVGTHDNPD